MTDQQINAAVAKAIGWELKHSLIGSFYAKPGADDCEARAFQWRPATDADDLRRAEAALPKDRQVEYSHELVERLANDYSSPIYEYQIRQLPLRTCCEALLEAAK